MDSRTEVNRQPSPSRPSVDGAVATEAAREPGSAPGTARQNLGTNDRALRRERRESVDPMRSTDRYRLVHPINNVGL